MSEPSLAEQLSALARIARGNGALGLSVIGCAKLAQELARCASRARRLQERAEVAEAYLIADLPPEGQGELTDGAVVVFPRHFSRGLELGQ